MLFDIGIHTRYERVNIETITKTQKINMERKVSEVALGFGLH